VYAPEGVEKQLEGLVGEWSDTFDWQLVGEGDQVSVDGADLRFSRTDHPPPTVAVEVSHGGKRLVYTSDTGPSWSCETFGLDADFVLCEATYQHHDIRAPIHLSARQAGEMARAARARHLMLTHLWPGIDPIASVEEGSEAYGKAVVLAAPHLVTHI
jgi:ribonuclease BN (tRNA processing enzyme)